jgi:hypothetical protein
MHDARWNKTQNGFFISDDEGVTRVMTPLEANDCLRMIGQPVNDFAFPFVTPLSADHYNITTRLRHMNSNLFLFVLKG